MNRSILGKNGDPAILRAPNRAARTIAELAVVAVVAGPSAACSFDPKMCDPTSVDVRYLRNPDYANTPMANWHDDNTGAFIQVWGSATNNEATFIEYVGTDSLHLLHPETAHLPIESSRATSTISHVGKVIFEYSVGKDGLLSASCKKATDATVQAAQQ